MTLYASSGEICSANNEQIWFERSLAEYKLLTVLTLASFTKEKTEK